MTYEFLGFDQWARDREAAARREREERRVEFFVVEGRKSIPDLEFLTPECSVCGLHTTYEDGWFSCEECQITWPPSGYGHKAEYHGEPLG